MLTEHQAYEIFCQRPERALDKSGQYTFQADCSANATVLGRKYNIASKTIRDIWNRKSWVRATRPAWTPEEIAASEERPEGENGDVVPAQTRKRGRPCGAKDTFPRVRSCKKRQSSPGVSTAESDDNSSVLLQGGSNQPAEQTPAHTHATKTSLDGTTQSAEVHAPVALKAVPMPVAPIAAARALSTDALGSLLKNIQTQNALMAGSVNFPSSLQSMQPMMSQSMMNTQQQLLQARMMSQQPEIISSQKKLEALLLQQQAQSQVGLLSSLVQLSPAIPVNSSSLPLNGVHLDTTSLFQVPSFSLAPSI